MQTNTYTIMYKWGEGELEEKWKERGRWEGESFVKKGVWDHKWAWRPNIFQRRFSHIISSKEYHSIVSYIYSYNYTVLLTLAWLSVSVWECSWSSSTALFLTPINQVCAEQNIGCDTFQHKFYSIFNIIHQHVCIILYGIYTANKAFRNLFQDM